MKMSRSHFVALADMLAALVAKGHFSDYQQALLYREVLRVCEDSNPQFDSHKFLNHVDKQLQTS